MKPKTKTYDPKICFFATPGTFGGGYGPRIFIHIDALKFFHTEASKRCKWGGSDKSWGAYLGYEFRFETPMNEVIEILTSRGFKKIEDPKQITGLIG